MYTTKEVSEKLNVSLPSVYAWISKGLLTKTKTVKGIRITEEDLQKFIEEKTK